jgi:hypothetical protein
VTVQAVDFASGPTVCSISLRTTHNNTYGPFGWMYTNFNPSGDSELITTDVSVSGKILRYISGSSGSVVDRLNFYFA